MKLDVIGAGAFGAGLAIAYARAGLDVTLWARDVAGLRGGESPRLPGHAFPDGLHVTGDLSACTADVALIAIPTQSIAGFVAKGGLAPRVAVSCAKGIDRSSGHGPTALLAALAPCTAQLTGPSFAADIARGLPTALTIACADAAEGAALQNALSTPTLRLYTTQDVIGAELGGALKNVIAIAAGAVIGKGLGDSARAALIARGFAEMTRYATAKGALPETLTGLSGLGDLILTCGSAQSRNFRFGHALATGDRLPEGTTVEGLHTARQLAASPEDTPIADTVAALADGTLDIDGALSHLLSRPLKPE
ncbi:NAD(P)H-dependent glycerol-3-phosphate dehydrogenase [Jannaschia sp. CCS1]|uniref:Glycerol-3-phosphate dehydrogenase [NAD(P)+] n=1 Tax=Jannaschia sp. (strain CCS1) TaxID=290400 RepID=GPDA_JANSC|nr:NAD(P)H-dependent glycerol-3-phosphate dehydrogenase [Jannaschia sp. CCS1]Q28JW6.1 RecName: Full=Glycerol-3-phosphate dehydrogenase [NAD(P)+]; AltName: Full=NAD(P)H-dependent glycerol-3-phosphate dehydrogenase [Jannaschia sp. CCS1]ABD56996.1 Glycerol-3-phosphate dehydrogenase (NAD(P)+) [Jannaschia sp. CCS1]